MAIVIKKNHHFEVFLLVMLQLMLWTFTITIASKLPTPEHLEDKVRLAIYLEKKNLTRLCSGDKFLRNSACPPSKYRSNTGACNNILHRNWGAQGDVFLRLFKADYSDGQKIPHLNYKGALLPEPEGLVEILQKNTKFDMKHPHITAMLPAWAKLLSYDLVGVTSILSDEKCCNRKAQDRSTECYVRDGVKCKEYKRTSPSFDVDSCKSVQREQMNTASGFIDGSGLYGSSDEDFKNIRTFSSGHANISACNRCNEIGAVGALHRTLLQEHNRVADALHKLNPTWSDTKLFFETRRIISAQIQHITYNEFLPIVLGQQLSNIEELQLDSGKFFSEYSSTNRAGVYNEFAVGAMPAFITMIPSAMWDESSSAENLIVEPAMHRSFIPYSAPNAWTPIASAVQMARDHGIPRYLDISKNCKNKFLSQNISVGERLGELAIDHDYGSLLKSIYGDLDRADLIVGALLENSQYGAVFGPTISCLLALQFSLLRKSDRFWYENDLPPSSFNSDQLQSIRRVTLSGVLCAASGVSSSQPKAFIRDDAYLNARLPCSQQPGIDLRPWKSENTDDDEFEFIIPAAKNSPRSGLGISLNADLIRSAVEKAHDDLIARKKFEYEAWLEHGGIDARSPDGTAASFSKASRSALLLANSSLIYELTSNEIMNLLEKTTRRKRQTFDNNLGFARDDLTSTLQTIDITSFISGSVNGPKFETNCEDFTSRCDETAPFRTLSGRCNNLRNPSLGQSLTIFSRLLPSAYDDGVSRPRFSALNGSPLPNPRIVSTLIHPDISNLHTRYSLMVMQYAQFLDHDLTMTPIHKGFHESIPSCRPCDAPRTVHPECNPFPVPPGDHYYPEVNVTSGERLCFPFMRSLPGQQSLGPREQMNQNSAYLDASQIYGENDCVLNMLKGFSGRLNSTIHPIKGKELLPQSPSHPECKSPSGLCFIAGDGRASEQPGLTAIHTTFLREHNRIVEGLRGVNPHWNSEQLFENARKIVVAQNQHVTYNEFLPRILSWNAVNLYGLKLQSQSYYKEYDSTCNPSIFTEFAAAAFRIGHSLLRPHIPRLSPNHQPIDPPLLLRDGFFKMDALLQPGIIDEINRGLVSTPMETLDQFITGEVTNHLFEDRRIPFSGIDLISLNVQRGRDHGIPSYNNYRALCNLKRAQNWGDLSREIPQEVINRFKKIYPSVDDIDLFPGAMTERPLQGGLVGPTLACIIGIQFRQLRKCDRFWYENDGKYSRFTEQQLVEIRKTTLAKIICENLEIPGDMQRAGFDLPSNFLNPRVPCHTMPQINLAAWRENVQGCQVANRQIGIGETAFPSPCTSCVCTAEGPQCASLRINDCGQLLREWPKETVLRDDVCNAQCGAILQGFQASTTISGLTPPPSRITRSRKQSSFGFKLPDLTPFITSL